MLPTVCDLFSCLKVGGDKDKWLHRAAEQVSRCLVSAATVALTSPGRAITQLSLSFSLSPPPSRCDHDDITSSSSSSRTLFSSLSPPPPSSCDISSLSCFLPIKTHHCLFPSANITTSNYRRWISLGEQDGVLSVSGV